MPIKTFTAATLSSSDVNTYLMNQAVITCTSATRPGSPATGMVIYETDTNLFNYWNGTAWATQSQLSTPAPMVFTPGGNLDTPAAGTATWMTLGNVTVPTWSTTCLVSYNLSGVYDTGTTSNVSAVIKVGAVSGGVSKRLLAPGVASQRFYVPIVDRVTGLSTGSQSVTISATFSSGTVVRADVTSFVTAQFIFQP